MTNLEFVERIKQAYEEEWGYIWGTAGEIWTQEKQDAATREQTKLYGQQWIGHRVADCSGLVKWALNGGCPHGSNSIWSGSLRDKSSLSNGKRLDGKPLQIGDAVLKMQVTDGKNDYYHIGVYVGNNKVIQAKSTQKGVVMTTLDNEWTHCGAFIVLDYDSGKRIKPGAAHVIGGRLNVRSTGSTSAKKLAQLPDGTQVTVVKTDGTWAFIEWKNSGYVMEKYLEND